MKKTYIIFLIFIFCCFSFLSSVKAEGETSIEWIETYGWSDYDVGYNFQKTLDGGYIITGRANYTGHATGELILLKTDSEGKEEWRKTYVDDGSSYGKAVQQTSNGDYIIAGRNKDDVWLIKTDGNGGIIWNKTFGYGGLDYAAYLQIISDDEYALVGQCIYSYGATTDIWLIKTNSSGYVNWSKSFGDTNCDESGESLYKTSEGGCILLGKGFPRGIYHNGWDVILIKVNSLGEKEWEKHFGGSETDICYSVIQTNDKGYLLTGKTESYGSGNSDVWLIKTDANGDEQWNKTFGGSEDDEGKAVIQSERGGYLLTGVTKSNEHGIEELWIIKTDINGNLQWDKKILGYTGYYVQQSTNNSYIITGETWFGDNGQSDLFLMNIIEPENIPQNKINGKSAPGFELIGVLISLIFFLILKRKRN